MNDPTYFLKEQVHIRKRIPDKNLHHSMRRVVFMLTIILTSGLITGMNNVNAQKLYVLDENNVQNEFVVEDISKLTFAAGNLLVTNIDGSTESFGIETINYLSFSDFSTYLVTAENPVLNALRIYPNPAGNVLNVFFNTQEVGSCIFSVYDFYGRILIKKEFSCKMNNNMIAINVDELLEGMYFLRMQQKQKILTTRFLKN